MCKKLDYCFVTFLSVFPLFLSEVLLPSESCFLLILFPFCLNDFILVCGPDSRSVVSGDFWKSNLFLSAYFHVENIFSHNKEEVGYEGYWLAPEQSIATFIINLGCQQNISALKLVNTHNQHLRDRSTKKFRYHI